jgi:hypothetical protein
MRIRGLILALFFATVLFRPVSSQTEPQGSAFSTPSSYYVSNGNTLQAVNADPAGASYSEWQVWLYTNPVVTSKYTSGLAYVRWGVIQGASARSVIQQLDSYQQFERAYTNFFGENTWGRLTFAYSIGPIAIARQHEADDAYGLTSKILFLNQGLQSVVFALRPSLVNGQPGDSTTSIRQYFDEVRDSMQGVARFYDRLSRRPTQHSYLAQELALLIPHVDQAESAVSKVTRILPSVTPPSNKGWMSYSEVAGNEGTITHTITEIGESAWVQESWTGGDGSMSGTNIITIVPYQSIGSLEVWATSFGSEPRWTLHIESANHDGFPQSILSPERATSKRTYPAVNLKSTDESVYLDFTNSAELENAYAFFLFHKQRGM